MTNPDPIPAGQLLAVADVLAAQRPPLVYVVGLAQVLLADALNLVDGGADPGQLPTEAVDKHLQSAAFHLEAALRDLGHLTPAHRDPMGAGSTSPTAVAVPGEPAKTPHWADLLHPAGEQ